MKRLITAAATGIILSLVHGTLASEGAGHRPPRHAIIAAPAVHKRPISPFTLSAHPASHRTAAPRSSMPIRVPNLIETAARYPDFSQLKAFSAETHYLSVSGYVRYWVHRQDGQWITYAEAAAIIKASRHVRRVRA
jgi:hypothetical protein